jgi:hypothetical protein
MIVLFLSTFSGDGNLMTDSPTASVAVVQAVGVHLRAEAEADCGRDDEARLIGCAAIRRRGCRSEKGVRLAQKTQVAPCIPLEMQLRKAEAGLISGPMWHLSH